MTPQPEPPEGYRLLTDEEKKQPLPMDAMVFAHEKRWIGNISYRGVVLPESLQCYPHATRAQSPETANGWKDIAEAPKCEVLIVTDWEKIAFSALEPTDMGGEYWTLDGDNGLEWQPTHFQQMPTKKLPPPPTQP